MTIEAYPLCWPSGWERSRYPERSRFDVTLGRARDELLREVTRLGGTDVILSTNQPLRLDGLPSMARTVMTDQGVAIYFTHKKQSMVFACDRWESLAENMRAVQKTIEALRGIERWGASDMMARAFTGFTALEDQSEESWCDVLGVGEHDDFAVVECAYRAMRSKAHPDKGGSDDEFSRITKAWSQYREQKPAGGDA